MIKFLRKLFKKKESVKIWHAEGYSIGDDQYSKASGYDDLMAAAGSVVICMTSVPIPMAKCSNSDIIPLEEKLRDSHNPINRCVFCRDNIHCYFAGECENKKPLEEGKKNV